MAALTTNMTSLVEYKLYLCIDNTDDDYLKKKYEEYIQDRISNNCTDSGFDLFLPEKVEYVSGKYHKFGHKIRCRMVAIVNGQEFPTGYPLHPRSSTAMKYNLMMGNSTGVIDADYRGEIIACMFCNITFEDLEWSSTTHSFNPTKNTLDEGTRIVQICAPNYRPFKVEIVDSLDNTSRGQGGFGSTGN